MCYYSFLHLFGHFPIRPDFKSLLSIFSSPLVDEITDIEAKIVELTEFIIK